MLHERQGVGARASGRAEAGHGEAVDQAPVEAEHVAGRDGDQGGERGIEAARDADVEPGAGCEAFDALGQAGALDSEDLGAAPVQLGSPPWARRECPAPRASSPSIVSESENAMRRNGLELDEMPSKLVMTRRSDSSLATSTSWVIR